MRILNSVAAFAALVVSSVAGNAAPPAATPSAPAPAAKSNCVNTGSFENWLVGFKKDAVASGVKPATVAATMDTMTADMGIIQSDRKQGFFSQTFLEFQAKLATANRVQNGTAKVRQLQAIFDKAEKEFGVPPAVIAAFWALESDFGSGMGKKPVLRSLATLAYDCRRGEMFRQELIYALKIIDRGDLSEADMIGSWAGELGQTQFLPGHYFNHALDYDGDGRRDLMKSNADIIGSSAAFIKSLGWKAGEPWLQEVRVPAQMAWDQADLAIKLPRSKWVAMGVTLADGRPLPADAKPASILLLMGKNGPAFIAYENFDVYLKWNQSLNYGTTAAYLATRIAGAPAMSRGNGQIAALDGPGLMDVQRLLTQRGFNVGEPDGKLGAGTRLAVKQMQIKFGMPADSYPTPEFLTALRNAK